MQHTFRFLKTVIYLCIVVVFLTGFHSTAGAADLPNGGHVTGSIFPAGDEDTYTFTANAGDHIELRMTDLDGDGSFSNNLQLFGPSNGTRLAYAVSYTTACIAYTAQETGTYTIIASESGSDNSATYNIYYTKAPGANEHGVLIIDDVHEGVVDVGDLDTYTFTANAGDHIELRMTDLDGDGSFSNNLQLFGPSNGTRLAYAVSYTTACIAYTAQETGTYTIIASESGSDNSATYNIYYTKAPGANEHGVLIIDDVHEGVVDVGDLDTYTFTANAGDHIELRMTDLDGDGSFSNNLQLFGPSNGTRLAYAVSYTTACIAYTAQETGTYTIIASESGSDNSATYNIYYTKAPGGNEYGTIESSGLPFEIIDQGDIDTYTISGRIGEIMEIQVSDTSIDGTLTPCIALYSPGGTRVSYNCSYNAAYIIYTVPEDGNYTLLVTDSSGSGYGEYILSYYNDAYLIDYCDYDFDYDGDIDGTDLLLFIEYYDTLHKYDIRGMENIAASLGKTNCDALE